MRFWSFFINAASQLGASFGLDELGNGKACSLCLGLEDMLFLLFRLGLFGSMDGKEVLVALDLRDDVARHGRAELRAVGEHLVLVETELVAEDRLMAGNEDNLLLGAHMRDFVGGHELTTRTRRGVGAFEEAATAVAVRGRVDGLLAEVLGDGFTRGTATSFEVRGEVNVDMAVTRDRVIFRVLFVELIDILADDAHLDAVAGADGKGKLDGLHVAELRELIEHEKEALLLLWGIVAELHVADEFI